MSQHKISVQAALMMLAITCASAPAGSAPRTDAPSASATMPLATYLKLYDQGKTGHTPPPPRAPVSAVVARAELSGKLTDDAVLFQVHMTVNVLDATQWVSVPVLTLSEHTVIEQMPRIERAHFVVNDGRLELLSRHTGRFDFTFRFIERASVEDAARRVSVKLAAPALSQCKIEFDRSFFALSGTHYRQHGDDAIVYPDAGYCHVNWARRDNSKPARQRAQDAPPVAPVVTAAHASLVATLEGDRVLRTLYRLRFSGTQRLAIKLDPTARLSRVFLNGHGIAATRNGDEITVDVHPSDADDAGATLELVSMTSGHSYLLKGQQLIELPSLSWPINVLHLSAHLPAVFNYKWRAGTLAPAKAHADVAFTHELPTPGKRLTFRRYLVSKQAARVRLDYDVDLTGHYFTGN